MPSAPITFDSGFLSRMERLELVSRRLTRGSTHGLRRSVRTGSSQEFADFRNYAPGDDLRAVDWNAYARLDRLFLKLFEEETDLPVSLLIDNSASMRWQSGDVSKLQFAAQLAAALGYLALSHLDRVGAWFFGSQLQRDTGFLRGKSSIHPLIAFLQNPPPPADATSLSKTIHEFVRRIRRRGLVVILSDFLDPAGYESALRELAGNHFEVALIQILDPAEIAPTLQGDWLLRDSETGQTERIVASPTLLQVYRDRVTSFGSELTAFGNRHRLPVHRFSCDERFEDVLLRGLRGGLLK